MDSYTLRLHHAPCPSLVWPRVYVLRGLVTGCAAGGRRTAVPPEAAPFHAWPAHLSLPVRAAHRACASCDLTSLLPHVTHDYYLTTLMSVVHDPCPPWSSRMSW